MALAAIPMPVAARVPGRLAGSAFFWPDLLFLGSGASACDGTAGLLFLTEALAWADVRARFALLFGAAGSTSLKKKFGDSQIRN